MATNAELSIVIVNWNGRALLPTCLASIGRFPPAVPYEVLVVDNASTDGSAEWLRSAEAHTLLGGVELRLIMNPENVGFGRANNQAFKCSGAPLLLLLNPDTEVCAGSLDALIAALRGDAGVAACGPRLVNADGSLQPTVWRNPPAAWEILLSGTILRYLLPPRLRGELLLGPHWDHAHRRSVRRLSGAALLVRRKVIEQIGDLDERFYMYGEDCEWCLRMVRCGWRLLFEPAAVIVHQGSQSAIQRWGALETLRRITDGQLRYQRHTLSRRRLLCNVLASAMVALASYAKQTLRGASTAGLEVQLSVYATYLRQAMWVGRLDRPTEKR